MEVPAQVLEGISRTEDRAEPYSQVLLLSPGLRMTMNDPVFKLLTQVASGEQMEFAR